MDDERAKARAGAPGLEGTVLKAGKGRRLQRIKTGGAYWSDAAEAEFLDVLAASCNVTLAAAHVGFTTPTLYRQRRLNPEFAARWNVALDEGFMRLREALLRKALDGVEGRVPDGPGDEETGLRPMPPMTVAEAMNLLKLHGAETRGEGRRPGRVARRRTLDEVRGSILRKLEAIDAAAEPEPEAGEGTGREP